MDRNDLQQARRVSGRPGTAGQGGFDHLRVLAGLLLLLFWWSGCRTTAPLDAGEAPAHEVSFVEISDSLADDPALEALIAPYRREMEQQVAEVIGEAVEAFQEGRPEGALGNFVTDAMMAAGQRLSAEPVHLALTNNGGLRVPIEAGPITVGEIYELMPFENMLTVLTLSGVQVDTLAQQLARMGGEPVAGLQFKIRGADRASRRADEVYVAGEPLDPDRTYRLVTIDYLANGGGGLPVLWSPLGRTDTAVLLRDAIITHIRDLKRIAPHLEGRIVLLDGAP